MISCKVVEYIPTPIDIIEQFFEVELRNQHFKIFTHTPPRIEILGGRCYMYLATEGDIMTVTKRRKAPVWELEPATASVPHAPFPQVRPLHYIITSEVEESRGMLWLWYPYVPAAKLTLLEGDPGIGKSWITCAIAAAVSSGRKLPGQQVALPPQKVLMISAEDGLADTVVPRLRSLDANLKNIAFVDENFILDTSGVKRLEQTMSSFAATMVFVDPLVAYIGSKTDMYRANEVREIMSALDRAAEHTGCAVIAVRHLRKGKQGKEIYGGIGSIDFTAAARSVMLVEELKNGTKLFRHIKSNNAPKGKAWTYMLNIDGDITEAIDEASGFIRTESSLDESSFSWGSNLDYEEQKLRVSTKSRSLDEEQAFLFNILRDGPQAAAYVTEMANEAGFSWNRINRAKKGIAISNKTKDGWVWSLVEHEGMGRDAEATAKALIEASKQPRGQEVSHGV